VVKIRKIARIVGEIAWRSFGLGLVAFPGGAVAGTLIPGGDAISGGWIAFVSTFVIVCTVLGIAIATTGKVTETDINTAFSQAVQKAMEKDKKN
jgi:hypothetical protein